MAAGGLTRGVERWVRLFGFDRRWKACAPGLYRDMKAIDLNKSLAVVMDWFVDASLSQGFCWLKAHTLEGLSGPLRMGRSQMHGVLNGYVKPGSGADDGRVRGLVELGLVRLLDVGGDDWLVVLRLDASRWDVAARYSPARHAGALAEVAAVRSAFAAQLVCAGFEAEFPDLAVLLDEVAGDDALRSATTRAATHAVGALRCTPVAGGAVSDASAAVDARQGLSRPTGGRPGAHAATRAVGAMRCAPVAGGAVSDASAAVDARQGLSRTTGGRPGEHAATHAMGAMRCAPVACGAKDARAVRPVGGSGCKVIAGGTVRSDIRNAESAGNGWGVRSFGTPCARVQLDRGIGKKDLERTFERVFEVGKVDRVVLVDLKDKLNGDTREFLWAVRRIIGAEAFDKGCMGRGYGDGVPWRYRHEHGGKSRRTAVGVFLDILSSEAKTTGTMAARANFMWAEFGGHVLDEGRMKNFKESFKPN